MTRNILILLVLAAFSGCIGTGETGMIYACKCGEPPVMSESGGTLTRLKTVYEVCELDIGVENRTRSSEMHLTCKRYCEDVGMGPGVYEPASGAIECD